MPCGGALTGSAPPLLLHVFPTFAVGGAQARFATLANGFGDRFRHAIVAMDGDHACGTRLSSALDVSYPEVDIRKGETFGNVWRFAALLRRLNPAVLITSNWGTIEWAIANLAVRVPHVHMEDGFGPEERERQLPRRVLARRLLLRRSAVLVPSRNLLRIASETWKLDRHTLHYIPNGIDLTRFAPSARDFISATTRPVIGTVAALRAEKNIARLIHAFALMRRDHQATLVIVGDGPERPALEHLARNLGVAEDIVFAGHIESPQSCYGDFDIFALTSDTEQMPLSVLEAMASGLAVVSTDVGDVRAMVAPENGLTIVARDHVAIASALAAMLRDPACARSVGAANRVRATERFGLDAMIEAHGALIAQAMAGKVELRSG
jgi:glycosyltransferase involved in cell wall biosynthesis